MTEHSQDSPSDPQLSRLYREYATEQPSRATDERILAAARAALAESPANPHRDTWWLRWRAPLALATTLLLTITLALLQERQPGGLQEAPKLQQEAPPARHEAPSRGVREQAGSAAAPEPARATAPPPQPSEAHGKSAKPSVSAGESDRPSKSDIVAEPGLAATPPSKSLPAAAPAAPAVLDSASRAGQRSLARCHGQRQPDGEAYRLSSCSRASGGASTGQDRKRPQRQRLAR